ncbi:MAG: PAS domain S-box protein [Chloroflexota bacterium]
MRRVLNEETTPVLPGDASSQRRPVSLLLIDENLEHPFLQDQLTGSARIEATLTQAKDITEAVGYLSKGVFHAILLVVTSPHLTDLTLLQLHAPGVAVIVLSNVADEDLSIQALQAGAQDFLTIGDLNPNSLERSILFSIERTRVENPLRYTEEQYRAVFAATTDGLVINDLDGNVVEVNPAFCSMHGYTREEMIALSPAEFIHPNSHLLMAEFFETVRAGKRFHCEAMDVRKDGSSFHVEVHGIGFTYKGEPHVLGLVRDITDRVEAAAHIRMKEEQYRAVFESTSDGLAISDLDANPVELNPAWCNMHGYTREEMMALPPTEYVHPDSYPLLAQYYEKVRAGERFQCEAVDIRKDGSLFHVEITENPIMYNGKLHTLTILRDITERVKAFELLEQRVEERTRELTTLLDVSNKVASTLDLNTLVHSILEQLKLVASYRRATIAIEQGEGLSPRLLNSWGDMTNDSPPPGRSVPFEIFGPISERLLRGETVIVPDVLADDQYADIVRRAVAWALEGEDVDPSETVESRLLAERSIMYVPLMLKDNLIGGLTIRHSDPGYYTERHAELAMAIANQAAIAVENARLYEQAQETTRKTAALAQIASQVAYGGSLYPTLDILCRQVVDVTGAVASAVVLRDTDEEQARMVGSYGLPEEYPTALNAILASGVDLLMQEAFEGRQTIVMRDLRRKVLDTPEYNPLHNIVKDLPWDAAVGVPMVYRDTVVGVLLSYHTSSSDIGDAELTFHSVIADQAAVAVENARLLSQEHDKARLEERQRLARELHDSVTQALFSINLIARSAEMVLQREGTHSPQTLEKLADLRQLTQGALAEMRALIFELRPGALEEEGLLEAIRKHAAAVQGREMLPVEVVADLRHEMPRLKPAAEEALYRITQEALHNVVKHAKATRAVVRISTDEDSLTLCIKDNGIGFDRASVPAGHMGLGTMHQRVEQFGGEYSIESTPGGGTTITACVPLSGLQLSK